MDGFSPISSPPLSHRPLVRQFSKQIAGHSKEKGSSKPGMLKHADGSLLKPILGPPQGPREFKFYTDIFDGESKTVPDEITLQLRDIVPQFRGCLKIDPDGNGIKEFMKMEDLTENLKLPCILDVKLGSRTYDEEASPDKVRSEKEKYKGTKIIGFCIPGMRVYQLSTQKIVCHGKQFGKQLNEHTVKDAFRLFLNDECPASQKIVDSFLSQLEKVRKWFRNQNRYVFYASSLLLVYDAAVLINRESAMESSTLMTNGDHSSSPSTTTVNQTLINLKTLPTPITDVRMIDFAHVFPSTTTDDNYLHGLNNLIALLEELRANRKFN